MFSLTNLLLLFLFFHLFIFFMILMNYQEFLNTLILVEFMVLNLFLFFYFLMNIEFLLNFILYFFVVVVCEGSVGLGILVSMIRLNGSSYFNQLNFSLC